MSNAKNTQTEKAAATETPVKKDGPMVYCGPTVKNTVKQYTVYHDSKAVPDAVNRFLDAVPMARGLLVPLDKFKDTRVALENPKNLFFAFGLVLIVVGVIAKMPLINHLRVFLQQCFKRTVKAYSDFFTIMLIRHFDIDVT